MHSGIYRFQFPYLGSNFSRNEKNEVEVCYCDVEIRVGQPVDMVENKLVTVTITAKEGTPGVQNFIAQIATKIRNSFFDAIFHEKHWGKPEVLESQIRWVEQHLFSNYTTVMDDEIKEVQMIWDEKKHAYHSPAWRTLDKAK
ncbi:hypothetical protein RB620_24510 [Paenibacillus sp. LHD-117]|uniref:hypothetical protein n=1 Tax=Paenibacillus sp. LHD-117 TaxID=3071412 RepID=UPI0027E0A3A8|nr:hypothetical protein [Paenibacillus sp. LHD-117]MDQ6422599.1 hypothetical protein [Paenibacillus sp. LHD-117]